MTQLTGQPGIFGGAIALTKIVSRYTIVSAGEVTIISTTTSVRSTASTCRLIASDVNSTHSFSALTSMLTSETCSPLAVFSRTRTVNLLSASQAPVGMWMEPRTMIPVSSSISAPPLTDWLKPCSVPLPVNAREYQMESTIVCSLKLNFS